MVSKIRGTLFCVKPMSLCRAGRDDHGKHAERKHQQDATQHCAQPTETAARCIADRGKTVQGHQASVRMLRQHIADTPTPGYHKIVRIDGR